MKHLLNICNINGAEVEPVGVIIGGSPCQDLSVAGKRAGLDGERSGLFMEQIRIIKEMRYATNGINPRYMVWENVPGAFSSNKGEDFRIVLEETAKIADEAAVIPRPDKGKWANSGAIMGDGWSIAWRVFDAQFWGVPQRRRRIALVADFGGQSAPEILFERNGVSGDIAESRAEREGVAGGTEGGTGAAECIAFQGKAGAGASLQIGYNVSSTLGCTKEVMICAESGVGEAIGWYQNGCGECFLDDKAKTIQTNSNASGRGVQMVVAGFCQGASPAASTTYFLQGNGIDRADTAGCNGKGWREDVCYTLNTIDRPAVFSFDSLSSNSMKSSNPHSGYRQVEVAKCIDTTNPDPSKNQGGMAVVCMATQQGGAEIADNLCPTITASAGMSGNNQPVVFDARGNGDGSIATYSFQRTDELKESQVASTQSARQYKSPTDLVAAVDCRNGTAVGALCARDYKGVGSQYVDEGKCIPTEQSVRRLTPLECERLQGFPDNWTDIPPQAEATAEDLIFWRTVWDEWDDMNGKKRHTDKQIVKWLKSEPADSARYKALGNSIALPPWRFVLSRIHNQGARTMASLFDGIGGFPKIWQELGGQTLWCSEVEPFPIAVTRYHFKEEQNGK